MIETNYKLTPTFQPQEPDDYYAVLQVAPVNDPRDGTLNYVNVSIHGGQAGALKELASLELTPDEAEELGSVLKVVARPDQPHDPADLLNAGKVID